MFCWKNIQILILLLWDFLRIGNQSLYGDNFIDKIQISLSVVKILHYRQAFIFTLR